MHLAHGEGGGTLASLRCTDCSCQGLRGFPSGPTLKQPFTSRLEFMVPNSRPSPLQQAGQKQLSSRLPNTPSSRGMYEKVGFLAKQRVVG